MTEAHPEMTVDVFYERKRGSSGRWCIGVILYITTMYITTVHQLRSEHHNSLDRFNTHVTCDAADRTPSLIILVNLLRSLIVERPKIFS